MSKKENFNMDWKFYLGNLSPKDETEGWGGAKARAYSFGATAVDLDDSKWRQVTLPHDFVVEGEYTRKITDAGDMQQIPEMESMDSRLFAGGSLEGGVAWYRKHFNSSEEWTGRRIFLHFGGIYRNCTVYLNEYLVGHHKNGYTSFFFDVTDFLNLTGDNVLAVRVDATGREGWWYEGGGIYRNVWLEVKEPVYVEPWGLYAAAKDINCEKKTASIRIKSELTSKLLEDVKFKLIASVSDANGNVVGRQESDGLTLKAWETETFEQGIELSDVHLWSLENPYLYQVEVQCVVGEDAMYSENATVPLGIRTMRFDAEEGFFLNNQHVRIQGLCCHHDHAGVGIATPKEVLEYRLRQMKAMGMNAYRSAHHQASPELLDLCDKMGILVLDETRRMSTAPEDIEQLRVLVKADRNHPCVFLWGVGNEEIFAQDRPEMRGATIAMRMEVRKLDDTRPITSAVVCWNGIERFDNARRYLPVTQELDVMGFNYCHSAWEDYHKAMPTQPIIITEASANSGTRGCYSTDEQRGQYFILDPDNGNKCVNSKKAVRKDMAEEEWRYFAQRPYLSGIFLWTGIDYRGEPTPLTYPAISSQFGIFDYCGYPKDNFYYYQSWWQTEPVLHVFPHWNHVGQEGQPLTVYCYSNLEEVELLVNGKSYGRKTMEKDWYLGWDNVIYEPGTLQVKGYTKGQVVLVKEVETTGIPAKIELKLGNVTRAIEDTAIIEVRVMDADGRVVPTADNEIRFTIKGAGELLGTGNGNPGSHESDKLPVRRVFHGLAQLLVRRLQGEEIFIEADAEGLEKTSIILKV